MLEVSLLKRSEIEDEKWDEFVNNSPQQNIYVLSWYLDCICDHWEAVVVKNKGEWQAVMPLNPRNKMYIGYSMGPPFAQYLGVLFSTERKGKKNRVYHREKTLMAELISGIPTSYKLFDHNFHPSVDYLLPFLWKEYSVSPRYTYWLNLEPGTETLKQQYTDSIKQDLKIAEKEGLSWEESNSVKELSDLLVQKQLINELESEKLNRLWKAIQEHKKGFILHAKSKAGKLLCAAIFLYNKNSMIYLLSASPQGPQSGANTLLIHQAILRGTEHPEINHFDFEGSMIESIEHYFRGFNPEKKIYYQVRKNNLPMLLRMAYAFKRKERKERK